MSPAIPRLAEPSSESKCEKCGAERTLLYEINSEPVYFCPECGTTTPDQNSERSCSEESNSDDEIGE